MASVPSHASSSARDREGDNGGLAAASGQVAVYVRCRPLQSKELLQQQFKAAHTHKHAQHSHKCVSVAPHSGSQKVVVQGTNKEFVFDHIFDEDAQQEEIFRRTVQPLLPDCFRGINLTILAYGQTGSGKTHTMGSSVGLLATEDEGLIPRVLRSVFDHLDLEQKENDQKENDQGSRVTNLRLSFVEIYNEEIRDLIHPDVPSKDIGLREDAQGRIFFVGAREEAVTNLAQAFSFLDKGCLSRTTGGTMMNAASSRSHAIFTINIEVFDSQRSAQEGVSGGEDDADTGLMHAYIQAKISLVDLAGSERAKRTGASGTRLKESVGINQGLLSLGKVIRALTSTSHASGASSFVPYRESKLTRFLQDSLGGNSRTLMFACVSKSNADLHETLTTLQYAMRARAVQNKIVANVMLAPANNLSSLMEDSVVEALRRQLTNLQAQLQAKEVTNKDEDNRSTVQLQVRCQNQSEKDTLVEQISGVQNTVSDGVQFFDGGLANGEVTFARRSLADEWEQQLGDLHSTLAKLEDVRGKILKAPVFGATDGSSSGNEHGDQSRTIEALESELRECKEDLQRDEEIFSEKVNELNRFRRLLRQNQDEKIGLESELGKLSRKVHELQSQLTDVHHAKRRGESEIDDENENKNDNDPLDVSVVVAASEPHISQLMEDLELLSREKEALSGEKNLAEQKYSHAADVAKQQKDEFDNSRRNLQKELKHLEIGIKMKEECIRTITREQKAIATKADLYELRIAELEKERGDLANKLQQEKVKKHESESKTAKEIGEVEGDAPGVLALQEQYQRKLRRVQEEIGAMRSEWARENEKAVPKTSSTNVRSSISEDLISDLQAMKNEHRRLHVVMTRNEESQKDKLDKLIVELEGYKQASHISQQHISQLEAKNSSLRSEILQAGGGKGHVSPQQNAPVLLLPPPPNANATLQPSHTTLSGQKEGYLLRHKSHTNQDPSSIAGDNCFGEEGDVATPLDQAEVKSAWGWLGDRMDSQLNERAVEEAEKEKQVQSTAIAEEQQRLEEELAALETRQQQGSASLARHCDDIDMKISSTQGDLTTSRNARQELQRFADDIQAGQRRRKQQLKDADSSAAPVLREELEELEMQQLQLQIELDDIEKKIKADSVLLKRYREHKSELQARVQRGALKEADANRVAEIKDELEALSAEQQLHSGGMQMNQSPVNCSAICPTELLRDVMDEAKNQPQQRREYGLGGAVSFLVATVIDVKVRCEKAVREVKEQEVMLNEKSEEFEQLALVLHRTRSDMGKKLERQKKEYEDKISFLLMQLRGAELQVQSNSSLLRKSFENKKQHEGDARRVRGQHEVSTSSLGDNDQGRISSSALGYVRPRPRTASSVVRGNDHNRNSTDDDPDSKGGDDYQELLRKYHGERERREMLEKRNSELTRELRQKRN